MNGYFVCQGVGITWLDGFWRYMYGWKLGYSFYNWLWLSLILSEFVEGFWASSAAFVFRNSGNYFLAGGMGTETVRTFWVLFFEFAAIFGNMLASVSKSVYIVRTRVFETLTVKALRWIGWTIRFDFHGNLKEGVFIKDCFANKRVVKGNHVKG